MAPKAKTQAKSGTNADEIGLSLFKLISVALGAFNATNSSSSWVGMIVISRVSPSLF